MRQRVRRALVHALWAGFLLHTVTTLWVWVAWGYFGRSIVITWMDFPVSFIYLDQDGGELLAWSLIAGGLQWAAIAALLTYVLGRSLRWRT